MWGGLSEQVVCCCGARPPLLLNLLDLFSVVGAGRLGVPAWYDNVMRRDEAGGCEVSCLAVWFPRFAVAGSGLLSLLRCSSRHGGRDLGAVAWNDDMMRRDEASDGDVAWSVGLLSPGILHSCAHGSGLTLRWGEQGEQGEQG